MLSVSPAGDTLEGTLREVVETLAPIDRTPCSPGEREAAEWLATRLQADSYRTYSNGDGIEVSHFHPQHP